MLTKPVQPLSLHDGPLDDAARDVAISYVRDVYTVRSLHVNGERVLYVAPAEWTDLQAIKHLLRIDQ